jgi:hypothetical protein
MASSKSFLSHLAPVALTAGLVIASAGQSLTFGQQAQNGFAVERFYPSAPGAGWFIMDDLNISGGLGVALEATSGYARKPLEVRSVDDTQQLSIVSDEALLEVGAAATYDRYRVYLNLPVPIFITGNSGTVGSYQWSGPSVTPGSNPDTVSDPRLGFDMRFFGQPGNSLRLGLGAQLIFPSGDRANYTSDGRYRGMLRFLAAGDSGAYSYAGQFGIHIRTLNDAPVPDSPNGNEFLFGVSVGRKMNAHAGWAVLLGPEIYGETAFASFFSRQETGAEGLLTARFDRTDQESNVRIKMGFGYGLIHHFGAPEWRILATIAKTWPTK